MLPKNIRHLLEPWATFSESFNVPGETFSELTLRNVFQTKFTCDFIFDLCNPKTVWHRKEKPGLADGETDCETSITPPPLYFIGWEV